MTGGLKTFSVVLATVGFLLASARVAPAAIVSTPSKQSSAYEVSSSDLLQTAFGWVTAVNIESNSGEWVARNGVFDTATAADQRITAGAGHFVEYEFDVSLNTLGYDITGLQTYGQWGPGAGGRSSQGFAVKIAYASDPMTFLTLLPSTDWTASILPTEGLYTKVDLADSSGGVLDNGGIVASGVQRIRFEFMNAAPLGVNMYRELDVFGTATLPVEVLTSTWNQTSGGDWFNTPSNWTDGDPNAADTVAVLGANLAAPGTVNLNDHATVGAIQFQNTNPYTVATTAGKTLALKASRGSAALTVFEGNHTLAAPITLESSVSVTTTYSTDSLTISGDIGQSGGARTLSVNGPGTIILSGTNSYGGGTVINGGALSINADAALGAVPGAATTNIIFNGDAALHFSADGIALSTNRGISIAAGKLGMIDTQDHSATINGKVGGGGTLAKIGEGTLTLSSNAGGGPGNAWTCGAATVNAGTLVLERSGAGADAVASTMPITNNATLVLMNKFGNNLDINNNVTGFGVLIKRGTGTARLGTYGYRSTISNSGGIIVEAGTLAPQCQATDRIYDTTGDLTVWAGAVADLGGVGAQSANYSARVGALQGGGTIRESYNGVNHYFMFGYGDNSGEFAGFLGSAANPPRINLTKTGFGTQIITGSVMNYASLTIESGTLQFGNGGVTGELTGNVINNGTLAFNRSDDIIHAGTITGSGGLVKSGAGNLTLSAAPAFTGPVALDAGTLTFFLSSNASLPGEISGAGNLVKSGSGTLTLSAVNSYSGATTVNGGTLAVHEGHSGSGPYTINNSGTLAGVGPISGPLTLNAGGSIAPGNPVGALGLGGLSTSGGGTLHFDLSADPLSGNDQIAVTGDVSLAGATAVVVNMLTGALGNGNYDLITFAGNLTGGAGNLTLNGVSGSRQTFTLASSGVSNAAIQLQVTGNAATLTWTGVDGNKWDVLGAANWTGGGTDNRFYNGDTVTFDDTSSNGSVSVVDTVQPSGTITVNNTATSYTLSGTGTIGGAASLTKSGDGSLTISAATSYSGATTINSGTVTLNQTHTGGGAVNVTGGTVDVNGPNSSGAFNVSGGVLNVNTPVGGAFVVAGGTANVNAAAGTSAPYTVGPGALNINAVTSGVSYTVDDGGTLQVGNGTAGSIPAAAPVTVNFGGTLQINLADGDLLGAPLTNGGIAQTLAAGANTIASPVTNDPGAVLQFLNGGTTTFTGSLVNNGTILGEQEGITVLVGKLSGSGTLVMNGTGELVLASNAVGSPGVPWAAASATVSAGTLTFRKTGDGFDAVASYIPVWNDATVLLMNGFTGNLDINADVFGAGTLVKRGNGSARTGTFGAHSTIYNSGGIIVEAGILAPQCQASDRVYDTTGDLTVWEGAVAELGGMGATSPSYAARVGALQGGGTIRESWGGMYHYFMFGHGDNSGEFSGTLTSTWNPTHVHLTKTGAGTQIFTGTVSNYVSLTIEGGTLQIGNGGVTGTLTGDVTNHSILAFDRSDDFTYGGTITGFGAVIKTGEGILTLTGGNDYLGGATVTRGTLRLGNLTALGSGGLAVMEEGQLDLAGYSPAVTSLDGEAGGRITNNEWGTVATLTVNQAEESSSTYAGGIEDATDGVSDGVTALVKTGGGTLTLSGNSSYSGGTIVSAGTLNIAAAGALPVGGGLTIETRATVVLAGGPSAAGAGNAQASAVPEPGTFVLLAVAALCALAARRRRA